MSMIAVFILLGSLTAMATLNVAEPIVFYVYRTVLYKCYQVPAFVAVRLYYPWACAHTTGIT
jgi:hypothetical protein